MVDGANAEAVVADDVLLSAAHDGRDTPERRVADPLLRSGEHPLGHAPHHVAVVATPREEPQQSAISSLSIQLRERSGFAHSDRFDCGFFVYTFFLD